MPWTLPGAGIPGPRRRLALSPLRVLSSNFGDNSRSSVGWRAIIASYHPSCGRSRQARATATVAAIHCDGSATRITGTSRLGALSCGIARLQPARRDPPCAAAERRDPRLRCVPPLGPRIAQQPTARCTRVAQPLARLGDARDGVVHPVAAADRCRSDLPPLVVAADNRLIGVADHVVGGLVVPHARASSRTSGPRAIAKASSSRSVSARCSSQIALTMSIRSSASCSPSR